MEETQTTRAISILLAPKEKPLFTEEEVREIYSKFLRRQMYYVDRDVNIDIRKDFYDGKHWEAPASTDEEDAYRLVLNYCRRVVLGRTAGLAKSPQPRIRVADPLASLEAKKARVREQFLKILWDDLMSAWRRAELNAAKCSYGVIQLGWKISPKSLTPLGGIQTHKESPFDFKSVPPKQFFPIYRSFNHANDFLAVYRFDPGRHIADIEERFGIQLQATTTQEFGTTNNAGWKTLGTEESVDLIEYWTPSRFIVLARTSTMEEAKYATSTHRKGEIKDVEGLVVLAEGKNTLDMVPFFVLPNILNDPDIDPLNGGCMSDMDDIIFLNQHLNHMVSEEADEVVTVIHRPIVYASPDHSQNPSDLEIGAGAVWPITDEEDVKGLNLGDQPSVVGQHQSTILTAITDLAFMGDAAMGRAETGVSGIAAQIALTPQKQFLELKLPERIQTLQRICEAIFKVYETVGTKMNLRYNTWVKNAFGQYGNFSIGPGDIDGKYFVEIRYGNLLPRNEYEYDQNESYRFKTGMQSLETTQDRLELEPEYEMAIMRREGKDVELNPEKAIAIAEAKQVAGPESDTQQPPATPQPPPGQPQPEGQPGQPPGMPGPPQGSAPPGQPQLNPPMQGGGLPGTAGPNARLPQNTPMRQASPETPPNAGSRPGQAMGPGRTAPNLRRPQVGRGR